MSPSIPKRKGPRFVKCIGLIFVLLSLTQKGINPCYLNSPVKIACLVQMKTAITVHVFSQNLYIWPLTNGGCKPRRDLQFTAVSSKHTCLKCSDQKISGKCQYSLFYIAWQGGVRAFVIFFSVGNWTSYNLKQRSNTLLCAHQWE